MNGKNQYLIYVCGLAATGKTSLSKRLVKYLNKKTIPTALIDKDVIANKFVKKGLQLMGLNQNDRDSPIYKQHFRDLEYEVTLDLIREQLKLGVSCVAPAPWTNEIKNSSIFNNTYQTKHNLIIKHILLKSTIDRIREKIINRDNPMDEWKLKNWEEFISSNSSLVIEDLIVLNKGLVLTSHEDVTIEDIVANLDLNIFKNPILAP